MLNAYTKLISPFPRKFLLLAGLLLVAIFVVENINHRFWLNDLRVYYGGAQALRNGTPVYGTLFALGSGYYKYSPFTLLFILPYSMLSFNAAAVIHYFVLAVTIVLLFLVVWHVIVNYVFPGMGEKANLLLSLSFICVINHLVRELHLGNINVILLLLMCFSLLSVLRGKLILAGVLIAIVVITKPFFGWLLLPLLLRRKFKTIFAFGISMLLFLLAPSLLLGWDGNIELHRQWLHTLLEHNAAFPSNNTIESLLSIYGWANHPASLSLYLLIAACAGYIIFFMINKSFERKENSRQKMADADLVVEWFLLLALTPALFRTDTQHFLLSLPVLMVLLCYVNRAKKILPVILFVIVAIMYGGNSSDMIGKKLSVRFDEQGILGISNLLLIAGLVIVFLFEQKRRRLQNKRPSEWHFL